MISVDTRATSNNVNVFKALLFRGWVRNEWLARYHTFGILILQIETSFANTLSLYRYDTIFDYGNNLNDTRAVKLLNRYFSRLMNDIQPEMQDTNEQRKINGSLTYPYLIPRWLPNGIQT